MSGSPAYLDPYLRAAQELGAGFEALLWKSPSAQKSRFAAIASMVRLGGRVIADIGCGNADLLFDLIERGDVPSSYLGVDAVPQTIAHATGLAEKAGEGSARFFDADFVADEGLASRLIQDHGAEVFVFSGSLNTLHQTHAQSVLDRFWSACLARPGAGLVFNFLSNRHDRARTPAEPPAVRFDPIEMVEWAVDRTPMVRLRHDYLAGHDATIAMTVPE